MLNTFQRKSIPKLVGVNETQLNDGSFNTKQVLFDVLMCHSSDANGVNYHFSEYSPNLCQMTKKLSLYEKRTPEVS